MSEEKASKSLLEKLKEIRSDDYKMTDSDLRNIVRDLFTGTSSGEPPKRQFWLFGDSVKAFHKRFGDKQFYEMVHTVELVTNTKGAEYVENFVEQYEKDHPELSGS